MGSIRVPIYFIKQLELYKTVKPYRLRFRSPDPSVPRSNIEFEGIEDVLVNDYRNYPGPLSYEDNGFTILELDSPMTYEESHDNHKLKDLFLDDLRDILSGFFKTPNLAILKCTRRRREQSFPLSHGKDYTEDQPVLMTHIDWSAAEVERKIRAYMGDEADKILSGRYEFVHIWKPFNEKVTEWPLALCDGSSVKPYDDLVKADFVRSWDRNDEEENVQVYYRDYHRWFYLSNQRPHEMWLFRQYDSTRGFGSGVPHVAVPDPSASENFGPRSKACQVSDLDQCPPTYHRAHCRLEVVLRENRAGSLVNYQCLAARRRFFALLASTMVGSFEQLVPPKGFERTLEETLQRELKAQSFK